MAKKTTTSKHAEIRLSGSGGQGLILAGIILARAAVIDGSRVTQTQSYGPESRGGSSRADVIISDEDIHYPEATNFDILVALMQEACDSFLYDLKEEGILIIDTTFVKNVASKVSNMYAVPFTQIALEKLGTDLPTNILALSFLVKVSNIVSVESLEQALRSSVRPAHIDLNIKTMKLGFELADNYEK